MTQSPPAHTSSTPFGSLLRAVRRLGQPRYRAQIETPTPKLRPIEEVVANAGREAAALAD